MTRYRLSPPVHKSNWRNIWEGIKNGWRAAGLFGKLTFVFRLAWSLLVLGFVRKMITVIFAALTITSVAIVLLGLVIWGILEGGYFFLNPITIFLAIPWIVALVSYLYLKKKYPGKYAEVLGYNTKAIYVRATPIISGAVLSVTFVLYQLMKPFLWWILVSFGVVVGIGVIYHVLKSLLTNSSSDEKTKKAKEVLVLALFLIVAIGVINWLLWTINNSFWDSIWGAQSKFWAINLGTLIAILLLLKKGADGKTHPVTKPFSQVIGGLVAIIFVMCIWNFKTDGKGLAYWSGNATPGKPVVSYKVPLEVARRVICECESGCKQYEEDGTPLKNRGIPSKGIPPSSAFGKYQFIEAHRKPALDLGYNLDTEDGQDKYFDHLFLKSGFAPWDFDEEYGGGRACWGPKLASLGYNINSLTPATSEWVVMLEAPVGNWGHKMKIPIGTRVIWEAGGKKVRVTNQLGLEANIDEDIPPPSTHVRFKSLEEKPVTVTLTFSKI